MNMGGKFRIEANGGEVALLPAVYIPAKALAKGTIAHLVGIGWAQESPAREYILTPLGRKVMGQMLTDYVHKQLTR
jgi:hypothetical protein